MTDVVEQYLKTPAYEGASVTYRNEVDSLYQGESPDSIAVREAWMLQRRVAHAIRNNGYAETAVEKYAVTLGAISASWKDAKGQPDDKLQDLWDTFVENPMLDGYGSFKTYQSLLHKTMFRNGNAFTRLHIRRRSEKIPLKLELIQPETWDISYQGTTVPSLTRYGITFKDTAPQVYHFRNALVDPEWFNFVAKSTLTNPLGLISIPANELIHSFIRKQPRQWIGLPFLASVLIPLYSIDELVDASVAKQKAAQAIALVVSNTNPVAPSGLGTSIQHTFNKDDGSEDKKIVFKMKGANVIYPQKGETVSWHQTQDIGSNLLELIKCELRRIAASIGLPYHALTNDLDGIDYSTLRGIAVELRTRIEYIHHFYTIPVTLGKITQYFQALAALQNSKFKKSKVSFQLPRFYGVDDLKDAQADLLELQNGMVPLQRVLDERHTTFEEILESAKQLQELKNVGIDITKVTTSTAQNNNIEANPNSVGF